MGTAAGTKLGRYDIVKHLASGGMAEVLLARATGIEGFERHVVIKRIREGQAKDASFVQMFLQEARLAAQLHHHNIVQVHDIGQENGEYFFAMEYVHGEDLRSLLTRLAKQRAYVPLEHVVTIIASAAVALHHAHEQRGPDRRPLGIVHRDVTPANILVGYDGNVKVVDFGIAKAAAQTSETQAGQLKGKASYMAPEQCTGEAVDRRSDVFALGIVLYELACTRRLFKADNDFLTMSSIVKGQIPPPTKFRPDLPKALEAIMLKALAAKREDRYQTADQVREALEQFAANTGLRASTSGLAAYMKQVFGERPEPWLVGDDEDVEISLTVDFDGSASGIAAPPTESVEALAIPQTVAPGKSSPIMKARKKAITDAPPSKQLMATVPTVVAAGKAVRAPVAVPKEPTDPVRIPDRIGAPEPSKPVLKPVVAAPAPRRKPITIQIPTAQQAATVPARTATPPMGTPVVSRTATAPMGAPPVVARTATAPMGAPIAGRPGTGPASTPSAAASAPAASASASTASASAPIAVARTTTAPLSPTPAVARTTTAPLGSTPAATRSSTPPLGTTPAAARSSTPPLGTTPAAARSSTAPASATFAAASMRRATTAEPVTEIDAGWGEGVPPPDATTPPAPASAAATASTPAANAAAAASTAPAADATAAAATAAASATPAASTSLSTPKLMGLPGVTRRATPPGAFVAKSNDTPPGAFLAKPRVETDKAAAGSSNRSGASPIASVLSAASMKPKAPDEERTSASAVLAELAATAPDAGRASAADAERAPDAARAAAPEDALDHAAPADDRLRTQADDADDDADDDAAPAEDRRRTHADSEPVAVHAPLAPDTGDTPGPLPLVAAPSEPAALPPPPLASVPRPGEFPVLPIAAARAAQSTQLGAHALASGDGSGIHGAIARNAHMTPAREPSSVPAEWPDASSAVGQALPRRLLARAKTMPKRIAAGAAGVVVAIVAAMHCGGGSKPATVAKPAPAAAPAHDEHAAPGDQPPSADETPTPVETDHAATTGAAGSTAAMPGDGAPPRDSATAGAAATATRPTTHGTPKAPPPKAAAITAKPSTPATTPSITAKPSTLTTTSKTKPSATATPATATKPPATSSKPPATSSIAKTAPKTTPAPATKATPTAKVTTPPAKSTTPATKTKPPAKPTKPAPKWDPNALFPKK